MESSLDFAKEPFCSTSMLAGMTVETRKGYKWHEMFDEANTSCFITLNSHGKLLTLTSMSISIR